MLASGGLPADFIAPDVAGGFSEEGSCGRSPRLFPCVPVTGILRLVATAVEEKPESGRKGKPQRKMTIFERVELGARVVAARHKPKPDTWQAIAKREGRALRVVQRVYQEYRDREVKHTDPSGDAVIKETLQLYENVIEWLASAIEEADMWTAKTAASRQLMDALKDRIDLLVATGRMPRSIQAATDRQRAQIIVRRMAETLDRHGAPPELVRDLLGVLDEDQRLAEGREIPAVIEG